MAVIYAAKSQSKLIDTKGHNWQVFETSPAEYGEGAKWKSTWHAYSREYVGGTTDAWSSDGIAQEVSWQINPTLGSGLKERTPDDTDLYEDDNKVQWILVTNKGVVNPVYAAWSLSYNFGKGVLITAQTPYDRLVSIDKASKDYKDTRVAPSPVAPPADKVPEGPPPPPVLPKDPPPAADTKPRGIWYRTVATSVDQGVNAQGFKVYKSPVWSSKVTKATDANKVGTVLWTAVGGTLPDGKARDGIVTGVFAQGLSKTEIPKVGDDVATLPAAKTVPTTTPKQPLVNPPVARVSSSDDMTFGVVVGVGLLAAWGISKMRGRK